MKKLLFLLLLLPWFSCVAQKQFQQNQTLTYEEGIEAYTQLANKYSAAKLLTYGTTDVGKPLHLFVIDDAGTFDPKDAKERGHMVLLINNAIHPGEPCGVDASLLFAQHLLADMASFEREAPLDVVVCIIPFYNVGGTLNRGSAGRANQNGPEEYGFRGNAKNYDLNRDFIKMDSKNAFAFTEIFRTWKPDIFIDNHTTNGYQYQYTLSLLTTQMSKMNKLLAEYAKGQFVPQLYTDMKNKGYEMTPYIYGFKETADKGIMDFFDSPRYSSGYTTLFNTIGFTTEAHKFKPFKDRVMHSYQFMNTIYDNMHGKKAELQTARSRALDILKDKKDFAIEWELDTTQYINQEHKGYNYEYSVSPLSGKERLAYKLDEPYTKNIKYYNTYKPKTVVQKPNYYVIPQGYTKVLDRLKANKVKMTPLEKDSIMEVEVYYIQDYDTKSSPYEGHYVHSKVQVRKELQKIQYYKGDVLVQTNDPETVRYIVEVLEPQATDSFFNWGFFDVILQQKEWFSDYAYEADALKLLEENPQLKAQFEADKKNNPRLANSHVAQLYYIYEQSPDFEKSYKRYPITRVL